MLFCIYIIFYFKNKIFKNKKVVFIKIILLFINWVICNIIKNFTFSIPSVNIGMEIKICKIIKINYLYENLFQLNDGNNIEFQNHEYLEIKKKIFFLNLKKTLFEIPNFPKKISFDLFVIDIINKEYLLVINLRTSNELSNIQIEIFKIILNEKNSIELSNFNRIILSNEFFVTLIAITIKDLETFYFTAWKYFAEPYSPKKIYSFFKKIF